MTTLLIVIWVVVVLAGTKATRYWDTTVAQRDLRRGRRNEGS